MGLLKGTENDVSEVDIKCTANIAQAKVGSAIQVSFIGVFKAPEDMDEIREIREKLWGTTPKKLKGAGAWLARQRHRPSSKEKDVEL